MSDFSPADAAFEGFKLPREHPRAVLIWTGVLFLTSLAASAALVLLAGEEFAAVVRNAASRTPDPAAMNALGQKVFPVVFPIGLLTLSMFSAAVYRQYIRPTDPSIGFLSIGTDELRIAALVVIYIGLSALYVFVLILAGGVLTSVVSLLNQTLAALVGLVYLVAALCLSIYLFVRLSLAGPQTFAERRITIFDSWRLTKGHFWKMLGAYVLSFALVAIVWLLTFAITEGLNLVLHGLNLGAARMEPTEVQNLGTYFTPQTIVLLAFNAFLNALFYGLMFSPGTVIYQELVQSSGPRASASAA